MQNIKGNGMAKEWFSSVLLIFVFTFLAKAQDAEYEYFNYQGLSFKLQTLGLFIIYEDKVYDTDYELEYNTFIIGANSEVNYYLNQNFGAGIGFGYEKVNQPKFYYYPIYLNLILVLHDSKEAFYTKANFGTHLGNLDQSGFLFKWGVGYRIKVYKNILANFEVSYSFQNIYKSFHNSGRPENYYNIECVGLTVGIEFNHKSKL